MMCQRWLKIKACKVFYNYYEVSKKLGKIVDVRLGFVQMSFYLIPLAENSLQIADV